MESTNELARDLLNIKAVQMKTDSYFTWTSGIQSPIYCDNRLVMSYPSIRKKITQAFLHKIEELMIKPDIIVGCATAGIPHAAWLATILDLPMAYVRSSAKEHGKGNQIEGIVRKGQKALVIEDLISTGGSAINAANSLNKEGVEVIGVFAIFTYGLNRSIQLFRDEEVSLFTILDFDQLVNVLIKDKEMSKEESKQLLLWRDRLL